MKRVAVFSWPCGAGWRGRAPPGVSYRPRTGSGTRSIAAWPTGAIRASGRAGWLTCKTSRSCPRRGGTARSGAPQKKGRAPALGRNRGGFRTQIPILADQRGRLLCLRQTGGPRHGRTQARVQAWMGAPLSCLIADRAYDRDAFRAWLAQQDLEAVLPARRRRLNSQPHDPERYQARNAVGTGRNRSSENDSGCKFSG